MLFQLNDQAPGAGLLVGWEHAKNAQSETELIERSLSVLRAFAAKNEKRFIVVVENFHIILADQVQGSPEPDQELLGILQDNTLFAVLATSAAAANDEDHDFLPGDYAPIALTPL